MKHTVLGRAVPVAFVGTSCQLMQEENSREVSRL